MIKLVKILVEVFYAFYIFIYIEKILLRKVNRNLIFISILVISVLLSFIEDMSIPYPILYIGMFATLLLMLMIFYNGSIMVHMFAVGNFVFHLLCLKGIIVAICSLYLHIPMYESIENEQLDSVMTIILFLGATIFLQIFQSIYVKDQIQYIIRDSTITRTLTIILIIMNTTLIIASISYYIVDSNDWLTCYHCLISIMMLFGFYIIFQYFVKVLESQQYHERVGILKQQIENQMKTYQTQSEYILKMRQIKHDYKSQLSGLRIVLKFKGKDETLQYLDEMSSAVESIEQIYHQYSDNLFLDAILQEFSKKYERNHIMFKAFLAIDQLRISDLQACTLFTNLLNNAYEANMKIENTSNRFVNIETRRKKEWYIVMIQNRYDGNIRQKAGELLTTKLEKSEEHGLGIKKVKEIVKDCKGMMSCELQEDNIFCIELMLPSS